MWARVSLVFFYCFLLYQKKKSMQHERGNSIGFRHWLQAFFFWSSNMWLLKGASVKMNMPPVFIGLRAISPVSEHGPTPALGSSSDRFFKLRHTEFVFSPLPLLEKTFTPFSSCLSSDHPVIWPHGSLDSNNNDKRHGFFTTEVWKLTLFNILLCGISAGQFIHPLLAFQLF